MVYRALVLVTRKSCDFRCSYRDTFRCRTYFNFKMKKGYPRFHKVIKCFAIEVCEGNGTTEIPMGLVYYIVDEQGNMLGVVDNFKVIEAMNEEIKI